MSLPPRIQPWNALIGWPHSTPAWEWTGERWETAYPASHSSALPLRKVARAPGVSARLTGLSSKPQKIGLIAIVGHNWSCGARWRVRISPGPGEAAAFDAPWRDVWSQAYAFEDLEWEDDNFWTGGFKTSELAGLSWNTPLLIDPWVEGRRIDIEIDDPFNPNGYLQHGLIEIAEAMHLPVNFGYGAEGGYRSRSLAVEAEGGALYLERREKPRIFTGSIDLAPMNFAESKFFEFLRQADKTEAFWWWERPGDVLATHRNAFLARNADLGLQKHAYFRRKSIPLSFVEVL